MKVLAAGLDTPHSPGGTVVVAGGGGVVVVVEMLLLLLLLMLAKQLTLSGICSRQLWPSRRAGG